LNEALEKVLAKKMHMTKAEFIRDAVRRELERTGHILKRQQLT